MLIYQIQLEIAKVDDLKECIRERPKRYEVRTVRVMVICLEKPTPSCELKECKKACEYAWTDK